MLTMEARLLTSEACLLTSQALPVRRPPAFH